MADPVGLMMNPKSGKVAATLSPYRIVLNKGSTSGVTLGNVYQVYELGDQIFDPDTKLSLGHIEIIKGRGRIVHVQENISILESMEKEEIKRTSGGLNLLFTGVEITDKTQPFLDPKVGDHARFLRDK